MALLATMVDIGEDHQLPVHPTRLNAYMQKSKN